ncbi:MAG: hypothetical protein GY728_06825, partial [Phycisphaeraceae bacterium]|nr:hypothetical protein [Phycisphaeraceae bacterium]
LNLTLVFGTSLGVAGLAWSTAACAMLQSLILALVLSARVGRLADREVAGSVMRTVGCTLVMLLAVGTAMWLVPFREFGLGIWVGAAVELAVLAVVGGAAFSGSARILKMPELRWALGREVGDA